MTVSKEGGKKREIYNCSTRVGNQDVLEHVRQYLELVLQCVY